MNVLIKADTEGSVDVLRHSLGEISSSQTVLSICYAGVGEVNDDDVVLAKDSNATIIAFRVAPQLGSREVAFELDVDIRHDETVYDVVDYIVDALDPTNA